MLLRKQKADFILESTGLVEELSRFGEVHVIGSVRTGLMATNDIDLYIDNAAMTLEFLHEITCYILRTFNPTWYEASEEMTSEGAIVYYHGFEAVIGSEKWNFDIRFLDRNTIVEAENFCYRIEKEIGEFPAKENAVLEIKNALIAKGLYNHNGYGGMDVYKAVFDMNILTPAAFFERYTK